MNNKKSAINEDFAPSLTEAVDFSTLAVQETDITEQPMDVKSELPGAAAHSYTDGYHDATQLYLREIGFLPLLSAEEELRLSRLARQGDVPAHQRMIESNLRLVVKVAKHYLGRGMLFLDLIEEGNLGLMHAVDKYNPELGFRFSTYATWWIRQAVERALMNQRRMIRLPIHKAKALNVYLRAARHLSQVLDHEPTCEEIAIEIDKPLEEIQSILEFSKDTTSLDAPIAPGNGKSLLENFPDHVNVDPESLLEITDMQQHLDAWLHQLTARQQEVLARRFGLHGYDKQGLEEVGEAIGLTRERVRQIQVEAIRKLHSLATLESMQVEDTKFNLPHRK